MTDMAQSNALSKTGINLEATESWRKAGFLCRPYAGNDREDAKRFRREFENVIDSKEFDKGTYAGSDVLFGNHEGRRAPYPVKQRIGTKCSSMGACASSATRGDGGA